MLTPAYSTILDTYSEGYKKGRSPYCEIVEIAKKKAVKNFETINEKCNIADPKNENSKQKVRVSIRLKDVLKETNDELNKTVFERNNIGTTTVARTLQAFFRDENIDFITTRGVHHVIYKPLLDIQTLYFWKRFI